MKIWFASALSVLMMTALLKGSDSDNLSRSEQGHAAVLKKVKPSIVSIHSLIQKEHEAVERVGSGFIIDPDGFIITRQSIIQQCDSIWVGLTDGHLYPAMVVFRDFRTDLVMLKIDAKHLQPIPLAESASLVPPANVMILGNSLGVFPSLTMGKFSKRIGNSMLIVEGWLTPGNSGAPVLDENGRLLGMLAGRRFQPEKKSSGISCAALPVETIEAFYQKAFQSLKGNATWVGLTVTDLRESSGNGVVVVDVLPGGPAYLSRIALGDTIVSMNGAVIKNGRDLGKKVRSLGKKEEIELMIKRNNQSIPYHLKTRSLF